MTAHEIRGNVEFDHSRGTLLQFICTFFVHFPKTLTAVAFPKIIAGLFSVLKTICYRSKNQQALYFSYHEMDKENRPSEQNELSGALNTANRFQD